MAFEIEIPQPENPWQKFARMYQDSGLFKSVLENIATHREQLNEQVANDRAEDATL
jgi:hypothetical protein